MSYSSHLIYSLFIIECPRRFIIPIIYPILPIPHSSLFLPSVPFPPQFLFPSLYHLISHFVCRFQLRRQSSWDSLFVIQCPSSILSFLSYSHSHYFISSSKGCSTVSPPPLSLLPYPSIALLCRMLQSWTGFSSIASVSLSLSIRHCSPCVLINSWSSSFLLPLSHPLLCSFSKTRGQSGKQSGLRSKLIYGQLGGENGDVRPSDSAPKKDNKQGEIDIRALQQKRQLAEITRLELFNLWWNHYLI